MLKAALIGFAIVACPPLGVILFIVAYAPPRVSWRDVREVHRAAGSVLRGRRRVSPRPDLPQSAPDGSVGPRRDWTQIRGYSEAAKR